MSVAVVSKSQPVPQLGHIRTAAHGFSQELLSLAGAVLSQELLSFFECRCAIRVSRCPLRPKALTSHAQNRGGEAKHKDKDAGGGSQHRSNSVHHATSAITCRNNHESFR